MGQLQSSDVLGMIEDFGAQWGVFRQWALFRRGFVEEVEP